VKKSNNQKGRNPLLYADRVVNKSIRLHPHEFATISEMAKREGVSQTQWMRNALRLCIEAAKRKELA
jgi:hypothetical protein